jgi:hypothetical protein
LTNFFEPLLPHTDLPEQRDARSRYFELSGEDELHRAEFERVFAGQLDLFDRTMAFNFELLVVIYRNVEIWSDDRQRRFVHAALSSCFNHLLFARRAIALGYPFENQLVLRSALEWFGRAATFHEDESMVNEFVERGEIKDSRVRDKIEELFEEKQPGIGSGAAKQLRRLYRQFSTFGHATFQSLVTRTFPNPPKAKTRSQRTKISERLGIGISFGGSVTRDSAYLSLINMITLVEMLTQVMVYQIPNENRDVVEAHASLRSEALEMVTAMQKEAAEFWDEPK